MGAVLRKRKGLVEHVDVQGYGRSLVVIRIFVNGLIKCFIVSMRPSVYS